MYKEMFECAKKEVENIDTYDGLLSVFRESIKDANKFILLASVAYAKVVEMFGGTDDDVVKEFQRSAVPNFGSTDWKFIELIGTGKIIPQTFSILNHTIAEKIAYIPLEEQAKYICGDDENSTLVPTRNCGKGEVVYKPLRLLSASEASVTFDDKAGRIRSDAEIRAYSNKNVDEENDCKWDLTTGVLSIHKPCTLTIDEMKQLHKEISSVLNV